MPNIKALVVSESRALLAHMHNSFAILGGTKAKLEELIATFEELSGLEQACLELFHALRSAVVAELGPMHNLADIEHALAAGVLKTLNDPAQMQEVVAVLAQKARAIAAELAPPAEPPTNPEASGAPPAPAEPSSELEQPWEYVHDASGIATGTRPFAAPPAAEPAAPLAEPAT